MVDIMAKYRLHVNSKLLAKTGDGYIDHGSGTDDGNWGWGFFDFPNTSADTILSKVLDTNGKWRKGLEGWFPPVGVKIKSVGNGYYRETVTVTGIESSCEWTMSRDGYNITITGRGDYIGGGYVIVPNGRGCRVFKYSATRKEPGILTKLVNLVGGQKSAMKTWADAIK